MTVGALENCISERELGEWMQYHAMYPLGPVGEWQRHAAQMALQANINRDPKKPAYKVTDFMPYAPSTRPVDDQKALAAELEALFAGRIKRKEK